MTIPPPEYKYMEVAEIKKFPPEPKWPFQKYYIELDVDKDYFVTDKDGKIEFDTPDANFSTGNYGDPDLDFKFQMYKASRHYNSMTEPIISIFLEPVLSLTNRYNI